MRAVVSSSVPASDHGEQLVIASDHDVEQFDCGFAIRLHSADALGGCRPGPAAIAGVRGRFSDCLRDFTGEHTRCYLRHRVGVGLGRPAMAGDAFGDASSRHDPDGAAGLSIDLLGDRDDVLVVRGMTTSGAGTDSTACTRSAVEGFIDWPPVTTACTPIDFRIETTPSPTATAMTAVVGGRTAQVFAEFTLDPSRGRAFEFLPAGW